MKTFIRSITGAIVGLCAITAANSQDNHAPSDNNSEPPAIDGPADSTLNSWRLSRVRVQFGKTISDAGYVLYTTSQVKRGVLFYCKEKSVAAALSLEPSDLRQAFSEMRKPRTKLATLVIGDTEPKKERWLHYRSANLAVPAEPLRSKNIYNAAVRNETITLSMGKLQDLEFSFPPPVGQHFSDFVENCSIKKKSPQEPN